MFEYFFIIGTCFLVLSGELDEFNLNKFISISVLFLVFMLSLLPDMQIKYTYQFSWVGIFILMLSLIMYLLMPSEHIKSLMYSALVGLLVMPIIMLIPIFNSWYFKSIAFSVAGAILSDTYFQGCVISLFSLFFTNILYTFFTIDYELMYIHFLTGDEKTTVILAFLMPFIIMAISGKKQKQILLEGVNGTTC